MLERRDKLMYDYILYISYSIPINYTNISPSLTCLFFLSLRSFRGVVVVPCVGQAYDNQM